MDNGQYGTTGGQGTATAGKADLERAARALGIENASTVHDPATLEGTLHRARRLPGPWIVIVKVGESVPTMKPPQDCVHIKHRFMAALGTREAGTSGTPLLQ
jgi:thiamine pyrophosphate-dependent acetolactate synthase large subunit-like protein